MNMNLMIRDTDARALCGNPSRVTWWRWTKEGLIPPPIKMGRINYRSTAELLDCLSKLGVTGELDT